MPKAYHHSTKDKRCQLCILKASGESIENIAENLEVHKSTLYRELTRNQGLKGYRFQEAHKMACERKKTVANNGLKMTKELIAIIESKLKLLVGLGKITRINQ